jgi:hypothetical protein
MATIAGGTLMKNNQCQLSKSVRCPPSTGPTVGASEMIMLIIRLDTRRFSGGKAEKATAKTSGSSPRR